MIEKLFERCKLPFPDNKIQIFSDGNDDYKYILPEYYAETCIDYGQLIKIKEGGRVIDKIKRVVFGSPELCDIETTDIENSNGILRERIGRLVRKTKCFSKYKRRHECSLELNSFKRGTSPAMLEGLTDHIWSWHDFLMYHYAV